MKGVNKVISLHSSSTIEQFRIVFDLDEQYARVINQWIKFAFAKRVRRLELNLAISYTGVKHIQRYIFPNDISPLCESLVTLSLSEVDVSGEILELFISNCPFLEELCVRDSSHLKSLRSSSPSIRLRRLEIVNCVGFRSLNICSPNLVSYTFYGPRITMDLKNVSSLVNLSLGAELSIILNLNLIQISKCLCHLETLMLHTSALKWEELPEYLYLPRLKKLIFDVCVRGNESLLCYAPLINGAPLLREIVLKALFGPSNQKTMHPFPAKGHRHHCLEVLQIEGFSGTALDVELAQYVLDSAVSLKKLVIDLHSPVVRRGTPVGKMQRAMAAVRQASVVEAAQMSVARQGIHLLKAKLPAGVQLIVL
ncbi:hypothetical protein PHJA_000927100 [Phtheirospermum japonicum]|uniref:At1g61320/AtMIF1 LRR domain-containing protein n=1 Tax=Phtheirospermum japonicum TaxID=374723 RepID=A0A830BTT3_9LAMI|nr:hypothetical protein PHJA_000927100 [Phtheirospermum japonicum]